MPEELEFVVLPGSRSRQNVITSTIIETKEEYSGDIWLKNEETGQIFPGYAYRIDEKHIEIFTIFSALTRQTEIELTLSDEKPDENLVKQFIPPMEIKKIDEHTYQIKKQGLELTKLHYNDAVRPYFMPLMGPFETPVTREYPLKTIPNGSTDHIHHRSLWSAWGDLNGTDNWSENLKAAPQIVQSIPIVHAGFALTHLRLNIQWMDNEGENPILDEIRDIFFFNLPGNETQIEYRLKFTATHDNVLFGDTKEAGLISIRVADTMRGSKGGIIENSLGLTKEMECWGKKASWCDYSGVVDNYIVGITLMDHPDNPGYPSRWHVRDYGLMAANPFSSADFVKDESKKTTYLLTKGESAEFKYKVFIHAGNAKDANVQEKYIDFINPPELKYLQF